MTRTGKDYINSLRDGRAIYLDGQQLPEQIAKLDADYLDDQFERGMQLVPVT